MRLPCCAGTPTAWWGFWVALTVACSDYKVTSLDPDEEGDGGDGGVDGDGGEESPGPDIEIPGLDADCYPLNAVGVNQANKGWPEDELVCLFTGETEGGELLTFAGTHLFDGYGIAGLGYSLSELGGNGEIPPLTAQVRAGAYDVDATDADWDTSADTIHAGIELFPDADGSLYGGDGNWSVAVLRSDGRLGEGVDELDDICGTAWSPYVAILDEEVTTDPFDPADCIARYSDIYFCPDFQDEPCTEDKSADLASSKGAATRSGARVGRSEPAAAAKHVDKGGDGPLGRPTRCAAGSGTFALAPHGTPGRPGLAAHWPVEIAGTGTLTDDAWVSSIDVGAHGSLSLARPQWRPGVAAGETPGKADVAVVLDARTEFEPGRLSGALTFLADEASPSTVEISWTCPTGSTRPPSAWSYTFTLDDVGCPVDWPQRFTLQLDPVGSRLVQSSRLTEPERGFVHLRRYGSAVSRRVDLTPSRDAPGHDFRVRVGALLVEGKLMAFDPDRVLVKTREVSWRGLPICSPGSFELMRDAGRLANETP